MSTTQEAVHEDLFDIPPTAAGSTALMRYAEHEAPLTVQTHEEVALIMEQKDEQAILEVMAGAIISEWIYEFKMPDGKVVEGIGVHGAMEVARIRAEKGFPIRFATIQLEEVQRQGEWGIQCIIIAKSYPSTGEGIGMQWEPYMKKKKNGEPYRNDNADKKALSKAKRNAVLDVVPHMQVLYLLRERKRLIAENAKRPALPRAKPEPGKPVKHITAGDYMGECTDQQVDEIHGMLNHDAIGPKLREQTLARFKGTERPTHEEATKIIAFLGSKIDAVEAKNA